MKTRLINTKCLLQPLVVASFILCSAASADVITDWNTTTLITTLAEPPQSEWRVMSMTHGAMFDAVNAITRTHAAYLIQPKAAQGSSIEAAAASAAHGVLIALYPAQKAQLDDALKASLAKLPDGGGKDGGVAVGREVAEKYVVARTNDGAHRQVAYNPGNARGQWRPTPPAMAPFSSVFWADVTPFVLKSATEVVAPGPLPLDSAQYTKDIDEVRKMGARNSTIRTADQTSAAIFSLIKGAPLWSNAARAAAVAKGTTVPENARIFALLSMATTDAVVTGWSIKRQFPLWRPITAIREATANADPNWEPLLVTPNHPDYLSGHCITSGASARMLALLFGGDGAKFSATFGGPFGVTRSWSGFAQAEQEIVDARVWAGIHTRTADEHSGTAGHQIAEIVFARAMRPIAVSAAN
jgi:hypothetical protein